MSFRQGEAMEFRQRFPGKTVEIEQLVVNINVHITVMLEYKRQMIQNIR